MTASPLCLGSRPLLLASHHRRRDPMQHPTRLVMCPKAKSGCIMGDACDMVHTSTEAETHPIALLRQLRSVQSSASNRLSSDNLLAACPFAAQLGIKQFSEDGRCGPTLQSSGADTSSPHHSFSLMVPHMNQRQVTRAHLAAACPILPCKFSKLAGCSSMTFPRLSIACPSL